MRAQQKRTEAVSLRISGKGYREIGQIMGVTHTQAYRWVSESLESIAKTATDKASEMRQIETDRLDAMLAGLQAGVNAGNPSSVQAALAVQARRAKLWGLDTQEKESSLEKALASLLTKTDDTTDPE
jgi:hypothetical protein